VTTYTGILSGDREIDDFVTINGTLDGSVNVLENGTFSLNGEMQGDLEVHAGGIATVRGSVSGTATNHGGELNIYGSVGVDVQELAGTTFIHPDSTVGGVKQSER
jgi:cytoskeletal protein CcmA (bactofilin family)